MVFQHLLLHCEGTSLFDVALTNGIMKSCGSIAPTTFIDSLSSEVGTVRENVIKARMEIEIYESIESGDSAKQHTNIY